MRIYIAGEEPYIDPTPEGKDQDMTTRDFFRQNGIEYNRLTSFFYKRTTKKNLDLRKRKDDNEI